MTNVHASMRRSEQGFTLVELAIVMVIIGLLIGGILKGQELIANAKISGTVTQLKGLDAALNTFKDKYASDAGLMRDAQTRLPNCTGAPCQNIAAIGYGALAAAPVAIGEAKTQLFIHLSAADLIAGIDATGPAPVNFGRAFPQVKAGGGMWVGTAAGAADGVAGATLDTGRIYAFMTGDIANAAGVLGGTTAAQIDRKLDDGQPRTGSVQAGGGTCTGAGAPVAYNEANGASCVMAARVFN